ncbi:DUF3100 domain-containing protein [Clostridium sp. MSJ-11]|uniref:DUF3100 domain-containing protein n=1 Tax=Clostridium mobile TaxID=2841512 RepID=A0ABS6EF44_9CLOT|nr:DUF3100 domain-containing protein [Clostridium mobile]MBU5483635.1 DUF3100 domain-containing protein [Clostridium mobile]
MKEKINKNYKKIFLVVMIISLVTEWIGSRNIEIGVVKIALFPMLYAVIIGILITPDLLGKKIKSLQKVIGEKEMGIAGELVGISLILLGVRYGTLVGPNLDKIISVGWAFLAQEFGHIVAPLLALPMAIFAGMNREAIGAATSIGREPSLGVISEKYGIDSPEGNGVLGTYLVGTVLGTIFFGILGSVCIYSGLHPYALAMACGVGSGSMTTAAASSLAVAVPEMGDTILAYAATSNMLSGITGVNFLIFVTLPFSNWFYDKLIRIRDKKKVAKEKING